MTAYLANEDTGLSIYVGSLPPPPSPIAFEGELNGPVLPSHDVNNADVAVVVVAVGVWLPGYQVEKAAGPLILINARQRPSPYYDVQPIGAPR